MLSIPIVAESLRGLHGIAAREIQKIGAALARGRWRADNISPFHPRCHSDPEGIGCSPAQQDPWLPLCCDLWRRLEQFLLKYSYPVPIWVLGNCNIAFLRNKPYFTLFFLSSLLELASINLTMLFKAVQCNSGDNKSCLLRLRNMKWTRNKYFPGIHNWGNHEAWAKTLFLLLHRGPANHVTHPGACSDAWES